MLQNPWPGFWGQCEHMEKREKNSIAGSLIRRMKEDKRFELAVYGVLAAVGFLLYGITAMGKPETGGDAATEQAVFSPLAISAVETENRLKTVLSCIRGVGNVEVMITYGQRKEGEETVFLNVQEDLDEENAFGRAGSYLWSGEKYGGEDAENAENAAVVCGVIVIAEGAEDISVRLDIQNAVSTVLGVDASSIAVFKMKNGERKE